MTDTKYLNEEEFSRFRELIDTFNISAQEMADIEGLDNQKEAIFARLRKKRVTRGFANKVVHHKESELRKVVDNINKFKF